MIKKTPLIYDPKNLVNKGTIFSVKKIASRTIEVSIRVPMDFSFIAGQYIWLQIPKLKYPDQKGDTRMFSIASSPNKKGELAVIFRMSESGYKKTLVEMAPETEIIFSGPYGSLSLPDDRSRPVVFMAGGVGLAPFLAMTRFSDEVTSGHKITLVYANSNEEEAVYLDELSDIEKRNPNFEFIKQFGLLGKDQLLGLALPAALIFVSGPKDFVDDVGNFLIEHKVPLENLFFEQFYPAGAGRSELEQRLQSTRSDIVGLDYPYLLALENTNTHFVITDPNGIILYANKAAEDITGYSLAEMKGNTPRLWGGLMSADFYKELWRTIKDDRQAFYGEVKNRRKNQAEYYASIRVSPIIDSHDVLAGFVASEEDISEKKQAEKALETRIINIEREKNISERLAAIVRDADEPIIAKKLDGTITSWNHAAEQLYGYSAKEAVGKSIKMIVPQDRYAEIDNLLKVMEEGGTLEHYQTVRMKKNGSLVDVSISSSPIRDTAGKIVGVSVISLNITKEKEIDQAKTEFVSLASHQLRTPLSTIGWYTEMLLAGDAGKLNQGQKKYLGEVYRGNQRMVELVNALLSVSRLELGTFTVEPEPIDLVKLTRSVVDEQKSQIKEKKIKLTSSFGKNLPILQADQKLLRMVFQNLLSNAVKYTPAKGKIGLSLSLQDDDKAVLFKIADTGYGIPKNQYDRIFTKLFRADNVRDKDTEGTGLGLYIVKSIMEHSGGKVWFESKENEGSTFYVTLPLPGMKKKAGTKELS